MEYKYWCKKSFYENGINITPFEEVCACLERHLGEVADIDDISLFDSYGLSATIGEAAICWMHNLFLVSTPDNPDLTNELTQWCGLHPSPHVERYTLCKRATFFCLFNGNVRALAWQVEQIANGLGLPPNDRIEGTKINHYIYGVHPMSGLGVAVSYYPHPKIATIDLSYDLVSAFADLLIQNGFADKDSFESLAAY
ncbi:MAG: hypothetical protein D6712_08770 [Chloroflexi bacterium]|nr:MAG: hypothetical protein D6712_08770 [Chloroflexota bacterium]